MMLAAPQVPPTIAGVALDGKDWHVVQRFYYVNISGFLLLPLGRGMCDTSRTPVVQYTTDTPKLTSQFEIQTTEMCLTPTKINKMHY